MVLLPAGSADVVKEATPLPLSGTWASTLLPRWKVNMPVGTPVPGGTAATPAVKVTVPVGVAPPLVLVSAAENVSDCPTTVERTSGEEEVRATPTPFRPPSAHKEPPLSVNTVPSGPMTVGT